MPSRLKPIAALLPLALATHTHAQQTLDPVVVTASRFGSALQEQPIAAQVISAEDIRNSSATTVAEVLSKLGGVHTRINFTGVSDSPIDLRGFGVTGDQNTLVLVNGIRISENQGANARISAIPLNAIERIEILRGSGAVLYGGGATGGTINIITRSPVGSPLSGSATVLAGSHDLRDVRAGMQVGQGNWGLSLDAQRYENDNYRDNNKARQNAVNGELRFGGRTDFIALGVNADDQKSRLPGARSAALLESDRRGTATPNDYLNSESRMFTLRGEKQVGELTLALDASHRNREADMFNDSRFGSSRSETDVDVTTISPRVLWTAKLGSVTNRLTAGFDWSDWSYDNDSVFSDPFFGDFPSTERGKQKNKALYLRDEVRFASGTRVSIGGRRENIDQNISSDLGSRSSDRNLSAYELALQQELGAGVSAYGRVGYSFRVANVDDNRCAFAPCPELLKPQRSHDRELGVQWNAKGASLRASVFEMDIDDEIHYVNLIMSNINLPPTRHRGLELEGKLSLGQKVDLSAHYNWTQARFREGVFFGYDVAGKNVPLVPKHRVGVNVGWQMLASTRLTYNLRYVGSQQYDNDQPNLFRKMPSYTLSDIKLNHDLGAWQLAAGINNLFDKKYYSYGIIDNPGAFSSGPGFSTFNAYPEDRRTVYVSATYRF